MAAHLLRKMANKVPVQVLRWLGNMWIPYRGAGIQILEVTDDFRYVRVRLKKTWYNSNYVGTHFGGSIYAMTDPFYMMMIMNNLGPHYIVWDKAARIDFMKPGRTDLFAEFQIDEVLLDQIRERTAGGEKYIFDLRAEVKDTDGQIIARIDKTIYVRKKSP